MEGLQASRRLCIGLLLIFSFLLAIGCDPAIQTASQAQVAAVTPSSPEGQVSLDKNYYLIIDGSGSMGDKACAGNFPTRVEGAKWAVNEFVNKSVPQDVNLGLYFFGSYGNRGAEGELVALGKNNRAAISEAISRMAAGGGTPLNKAIQRGTEVLVKQRALQLGYGEFYLVVATDGEATDGPNDASNGVKYAMQNSIPIITIGFCLQSDHPLAKSSLSYRNATNPNELLAGLQETQGESAYFDAKKFSK